MYQEPNISIIVAVYNVAKYLERGIKQILHQSYNNYEIILVDDGSTDGCGEICKKIAEKDRRVRVFQQQNLGSGAARNLGILNAKGKYIWFYDVDDIISPDLINKCVKHIKVDTDVLIFSYTEINQQFKTQNTCKFKDITYHSNNEIRDNYIEDLSGLKFNNGFVWNKIYNRHFLLSNKILFPDLLIQQDEVFNLNVYKYAINIKTISDVLYFYHVYNIGNTRSNFIKNRFEIYCEVNKHFIDLYKFWNLNDKKFLIYIYNRFLIAIISCLTYNCYHKDSNFNQKERFNYINSILNSDKTANCIMQLNALDYEPQHYIIKKYYSYLANKSIKKFKYIWYLEKFTTKLRLIYIKFIR